MPRPSTPHSQAASGEVRRFLHQGRAAPGAGLAGSCAGLLRWARSEDEAALADSALRLVYRAHHHHHPSGAGRPEVWGLMEEGARLEGRREWDAALDAYDRALLEVL